MARSCPAIVCMTGDSGTIFKPVMMFLYSAGRNFLATWLTLSRLGVIGLAAFTNACSALNTPGPGMGRP